MKNISRHNPEPIPLSDLIADIDRSLRTSHGDRDEEETSGRALNPQFVRFHLGDVQMATPLENVSEIGRKPQITPLPNLPGWVPGVSNIRGEIISIVDLKGFFGMTPATIQAVDRFIVLQGYDMKLGALVDRISGIFSVDRVEQDSGEGLYEKSDAQTLQWTRFVGQVFTLGNEIISILDVEKLLASRKMNAFRSKSGTT